MGKKNRVVSIISLFIKPQFSSKIEVLNSFEIIYRYRWLEIIDIQSKFNAYQTNKSFPIDLASCKDPLLAGNRSF